jgi:hypothetical protein
MSSPKTSAVLQRDIVPSALLLERVEDVTVKDIKGRLMILKHKEGEIKIVVPPDIPVVKRVLGDRTQLKAGAEISLQANRIADGTLSATQITVRVAP